MFVLKLSGIQSIIEHYLTQIIYINVKIGSWLLSCIASHLVIALPTIVTVIVVALLHS